MAVSTHCGPLAFRQGSRGQGGFSVPMAYFFFGVDFTMHADGCGRLVNGAVFSLRCDPHPDPMTRAAIADRHFAWHRQHQRKDKTMTSNKPAATIRDGNLKATIWRNEGQHGPWFSTEITRSFKTDNGYQDSKSFRGTDLLRASLLAQQAYIVEQELRFELSQKETAA